MYYNYRVLTAIHERLFQAEEISYTIAFLWKPDDWHMKTLHNHFQLH